MYQVSYDGKNWENVKEDRARRILTDHFADVSSVLEQMAQGREVRTTFAVYRVNPATRPAAGAESGEE